MESCANAASPHEHPDKRQTKIRAASNLLLRRAKDLAVLPLLRKDNQRILPRDTP